MSGLFRQGNSTPRHCITVVLVAAFLTFLYRNKAGFVYHTADLSTSTASAHFVSRRRGTHPRDYYLDPFNTSCVRPSFLSDGSLSNDDDSPVCFSGEGIRVAVLDTGLCSTVAEWSRNEVHCTSFVPGVACEDDGCGHGTRSVSVLAGHLLSPAFSNRNENRRPSTDSTFRRLKEAELHTSFSQQHYFGMAPRASVHVLRVFDRAGRTRQRYLARALDLLLHEAEQFRAAQQLSQATTAKNGAHLASLPPPVDIVSMSYGSEDYYDNADVQRRLYTLVHHYGVLVVVAAGNDRYRFGSLRSPADLPDVLAVGAVKLSPLPTSAVHGTTRTTCRQPRSASRSAPLPSSSSSTLCERSVVGFSGRGPTTWELPFGAGRVKPDLVALGQRVWTVEGVLLASRSSSSSSSRLRLRSASGTSVAAPIVAGAAALLLEVVRRDAEVHFMTGGPVASSGITKDDYDDGHNSSSTDLYWVNRLRTSLRARQLLLRTAEPLVPLPRKYQEDADSRKGPSTPDRAGSVSDTFHLSSEAENVTGTPTGSAGFALTQLYTRYLHLTRWSVLSQGMGEVQPRHALRYALASVSSPSRPPTACASFAIPASMVVGRDEASKSEVGNTLLSTSEADMQKQPSDLYWWPYSDMAIYPGAVPLLLNFSVHLCPPMMGTCGDASHGGCEVRFQLTKVIGHQSPRQVKLFRRGRNTPPVELFSCNNESQSHTERLLERHLLRAALELWPVAPPSPSPSSPLPRAAPSARLSTTAFTLSLAMYAPPTAHTRLRYCATTTTTMMSRVVSDAHTAERSSTSNSNRHDCVALFHAFSQVTVEGEVRVYSAARKGRGLPQRCCGSSCSSSSAVLAIPVTLRVRAPPPRSQRVLVDTSLDWFNPTATSSDLFIAGDDPHEETGASSALVDNEDLGRRSVHVDSYAETGGDHPHTNLALLYLYLTRSLGLAVSFFPLLHVATSATTLSNPTEESSLCCSRRSNKDTCVTCHVDNLRSMSTDVAAAAAAAAAMLSDTGTLMVVDPERPLTRRMRRVLTSAVRPASAKEGLRVVLVSEWHSAEVAAALRWTRDMQHEDTFPGHSGSRKQLRSWRYENSRHRNSRGLNGSSSPDTSTPRVRGLRGSCHTPSWNRWLDDVASADGSALDRRTKMGMKAGNKAVNAGDRHAPSAPLHLSEEVVIDGALVVSTRDAASLQTSSEANGSRADVLRSLGQLNAAGVVQWTTTAAGSWHRRKDVSALRLDNDDEVSTAVLCNVMPSWSRMQRRLRKRAKSTSPSSSCSLLPSAYDASYTDAWERISEEEEETLGSNRSARGAESKAPDTHAVQSPALSAKQDAVTSFPPPSPPPLSHGILALWSLPRHSLKAVTSSDEKLQATVHETPPSPQPGRVAIFTDSNCLSVQNHNLQRALQALDTLLSAQERSPVAPPSADALQRLLASAAGQRFAQEESLQSSTCVEVVKELLNWVVTGDVDRWRTAAQLQCEARTSAFSSLSSVYSDGNNHSWYVEHSHQQRTATVDVDDDDLLHTAPKRAEVGAGVTRLWRATVLAAWWDEENNGTEVVTCDSCSHPAWKLRNSSFCQSRSSCSSVFTSAKKKK